MDVITIIDAALFEIVSLVVWFKEEGRQAALLG